MKLYLREIKTGMKPFFFWSLGLLVFTFAGIVKFTGISGSGMDINALLAGIPKVIMAFFGMSGLDISRIQGYYGVLSQYMILLTAIYGLYLGGNAVSRESVDKTYEFLFTKPRSRSQILGLKLLAGASFLALYTVLNVSFTFLALGVLNQPENITGLVFLLTGDALLVGLFFFSLGAILSAVFSRPEKGVRLGNIILLGTYIVAVAYDMLENAYILRFFTPFRFFLPAEAIACNPAPVFYLVSILLSVLFLLLCFRIFEKKDLLA